MKAELIASGADAPVWQEGSCGLGTTPVIGPERNPHQVLDYLGNKIAPFQTTDITRRRANQVLAPCDTAHWRAEPADRPAGRGAGVQQRESQVL